MCYRKCSVISNESKWNLIIILIQAGWKVFFFRRSQTLELQKLKVLNLCIVLVQVNRIPCCWPSLGKSAVSCVAPLWFITVELWQAAAGGAVGDGSAVSSGLLCLCVRTPTTTHTEKLGPLPNWNSELGWFETCPAPLMHALFFGVDKWMWGHLVLCVWTVFHLFTVVSNIRKLLNWIFFPPPCFHFSFRALMPRTLESQITMEKTPSYFVTKETPHRISAMSRDTKLIVVVRDPVTRAISDYTQTLSKTPELPSFQELAFKNQSLGVVDMSWNAIRIGLYVLHLENWLRYFPLAQIHFVSGERLITDPAGELARVQDFLGLKRIVTDKHFYFNRTKGFPCLKKPESSGSPRCLGKSKGRTHVQIDTDAIEQLRDFYRPYNVRFYEMVGHDFKWE